MEDVLVEERRALVVTPNAEEEDDRNPILRVAHFLKPSATNSSDALLPNLPPPSPPSPLPPLQLDFPAWGNLARGWDKWVGLMEPEHSGTWRKAGIFEPIKASATAQVVKDSNLIVELGRRWSPETNTFVFPWGEATVTLEDVMVIGGYSVSGSPVPGEAGTVEMLEIEERLYRARSELNRGKGRKADFSGWKRIFMSNGSKIEHEAFLALFLSRFVFPRASRVINPSSFPIAIQLARGKRVALAPAVLANIYTGLSLLRNRIVSLARGEIEQEDSVYEKLSLLAPFQLVQVWAWERFPNLGLKPGHLREGEPRIARWAKLNSLKLDDVGLALDSSRSCFRWCPYSKPGKHLRPHEKWTLVNADSNEELRSLAQCLVARELVGYDQENSELYQPHRVAMQFGFDQDLPGHVNCRTSEKPISNVRLYVPSYQSKPGVTARYLNWWEKWKSGWEDAGRGVVDLERTSKRPKESLGKWMAGNDLCTPPGFGKKWDDPGPAGSSDEDDLTIREFLRSRRKEEDVMKRDAADVAVGGSKGAEEDSGCQSEMGETNNEEDARESRKPSAAEMKVKELRAR